jgi:hypothetical protein
MKFKRGPWNPKPGNDRATFAGIPLHGAGPSRAELHRATQDAARPGRSARTIMAQIRRDYPLGARAEDLLEAIQHG